MTVVLGLAAATDATWDPTASVLLALAAVWLPQALFATALHTTPSKDRRR